MFWSSSALGIRPNASSTGQAVCIQVTPSPENGIFCSLCFQSLTHSFARVFSTTPLQSCSSTLFAKNTGGGYIPPNLLFVFKGFRTLQNSACPKLAHRSSLARSCTRQAAEAGRPVVAPLEPRCFPTENALYLFSLLAVAGLFPSQRGGYTPLPLSRAGLAPDRSGRFDPAGGPRPFYQSQVAIHQSLHFASSLSFCYSHRRRGRSGQDRHPERAQRGGSTLPFQHAHSKEAHHVRQ